MSGDYADLDVRLAAVGVPGSAKKGALVLRGPLQVLANTSFSARPFEDLLLEALPRLHGREREMVVRALTERGMKRAGPILVGLFREIWSADGSGLAWVVGNAVSVIADRGTYDKVVQLCADASLGDSRQMLFSILPRMKSDEAYECALSAVGDPSVRAHAIEAIGRCGRVEALDVLRSLKTDPKLYEHKARATAIRRLDRLRGEP